MNEVLVVLFLLFTKHFILDFPLQTQYQLQHKGTYGHLGGILHSGLHGIGTWLSLVAFTPFAIWLAFVDFVVHYHIDWAKMHLNRITGWTPNQNQFWWLLGLDQYLHAVTYIILVYFTFKG